jgi:hypothetical protein
MRAARAHHVGDRSRPRRRRRSGQGRKPQPDDSMRVIRDIAGLSPSGFAYRSTRPTRHCGSGDVVGRVKAAGRNPTFRYACSATLRACRSRVSRFAQPDLPKPTRPAGHRGLVAARMRAARAHHVGDRSRRRRRRRSGQGRRPQPDDSMRVIRDIAGLSPSGFTVRSTRPTRHCGSGDVVGRVKAAGRNPTFSMHVLLDIAGLSPSGLAHRSTRPTRQARRMSAPGTYQPSKPRCRAEGSRVAIAMRRQPGDRVVRFRCPCGSAAVVVSPHRRSPSLP